MPNDDKLTLEFTRAEAFQLLTMIRVLETIEVIYAPAGIVTKPEEVLVKLRRLQVFVEGNST